MAIHSLFLVDVALQGNQDTFYNLTIIGRISLIVLSIALIVVLFWVNEYKSNVLKHLFLDTSRWKTWLLDVFLTVILFAIALYFSRQIYYGLYQLLFDNLSFQWVLPPLFELVDVYQFLVFDDRESYSGLLKGITFWTMLLLSSWSYFLNQDLDRSFRK